MNAYSLQQGLPDNYINALLQDQRGFIWIGTNDGLCRFDGIQFKVFRYQPGAPESISNNKINALLEDRQGYLWIATDRGVNRYEPATETFQHFLHDPAKEGSLSHNYVRTIFEDSEGIIWAGTYSGLNRLDARNSSFTLYQHAETYEPIWINQSFQDVSVIEETAEGQLLVGYWGMGLMVFDKQTGHFRLSPSSDLTFNHKNLVVEAIARSEDGQFWVTAGGSLYRYESAEGLTPIPGFKNLSFFSHTPTGDFLACGQGLSVLDRNLEPIQAFNPAPTAIDPNYNQVKTSLVDQAGDIWLGTQGGGLFQLVAEHKPFYNYTDEKVEATGMPFQLINSLVEVDEDVFWVGSRRQGIKIFNQQTQTFSPLPPSIDYPQGLKTKEISALYLDSKGNIWIGTWGAGLHLYRPDQGTFQYFRCVYDDPNTLADDFVTDILETAEEEIWVGTTLGLSVFFDEKDVEAGKFKRYGYERQAYPGLNDYRVTCITQTRSGQIWIGTGDGLHLYDRRQDTFALFRNEPDNPRSLSDNTIRCIFEDSRERLWVGTSAGLNLVDADQGIFRHFPSMKTLSDGYIVGIQEDEKGFLWVATKKGISRFDPNQLTLKNYDSRDGLDTYGFAPHAFFRSPHHGRIYAGGRNGLSVFDPGAIKDNSFVPPVWITGLKKYNSLDEKDTETHAKELTGVKRIELTHRDNILTFELTALNFRNPEKNQFAYRLDGFSDNWIPIGNRREITFTNLDAGNYTLQVKAANNDGVWNETPAELSIVVFPPWWKTWWAYLLYAALLLVVIFSLRRYELNRQRLRYDLKAEMQEADRLKELDTVKSRLYTNLTHEFRTPLTVILGMIGQIRSQPQKYLEEGARIIETNGKNLLRLINQLLDLSKLESHSFQFQMQQSDIVSYLRYVTESFQTYANSKNLALRFFTTLESLEMDFDPEQIKKVLTNLISNALKFTHSEGEVKVSVYKEEEWLLLIVQDTGIGIAEANLPHIFDRFYQVDGSSIREGEGTGIGLAHTQELVKQMGGQVSVESELGKGSSFSVRLPVLHQAEKKQVAFEQMEVWDRKPEKAAETTAPPAYASERPQLLLIEDNPDLVVYLKSCLDEWYQVEVAYNGKIGIEKALENIPDLIISDVMMPEKDGFEVCDTLKNDTRTSHIPIILLTAKADNVSRIAGLKRGADAYLSKPFDKEELLVRLDALLERQKRMAAWFAKTAEGANIDAAPDEVLEESIQIEDAFIQQVRTIVEANYTDEDFGLPQLCQKIRMSRSQLYRKMRALIQTSPSDYIRMYRLRQAKILLETTDLTVSEVAWKVGYKDVAHFSKSFQQAFGSQPSVIAGSKEK